MAATGNNSGGVYPEVIVIEGHTLDYFKKHSELIAILLENQGNEESLELGSDVLFGGDTNKWKLFLDLFFPEEAYGKLFEFRAGKVFVKENRGGEEALMDVLRYMMVNEPGTELEFAKEQARKQINAPSETAPRGLGVRAQARPTLQLRNNYFFEFGNNNGNNSRYNNLENNNEGNTKLGYTEEEEEVLGKLKGVNAKKYFANQGGRRRSNRRTRRNKTRRSSRKNRKQTRRMNRK